MLKKVIRSRVIRLKHVRVFKHNNSPFLWTQRSHCVCVCVCAVGTDLSTVLLISITAIALITECLVRMTLVVRDPRGWMLTLTLDGEERDLE